ncbi:HAMP domain-containing histidine kinase [Bacillus shivajii]|uniref:sensor histidine kinase n=1 Tax=Bacillus shivajii TaxID=1983719 RepID=UPI001CFBA187|nr:HAMP domain-containing sensor histidine kinase [Bacillus shivajii]UCZ53556.1 HAMP domain-containing histidine kinase [Bacillus shivajii]
MFHKSNNKSPSMFFQLTSINFGIVALLIIISSYTIYTTACFLVEELPAVSEEKQSAFNEQLAVFLWWITPVIIVVGALFHYIFTKRMMTPLQELVKSTTALKEGKYPPQITTTSFREIDQLTMHFNELNTRLEKNEEARNKMLTDMAHELRTPLSNINGYLEAMKDGVINGNPALYQSLHKESERLIDMVEQIHEMSKWNEISSYSMGQKEKHDIRTVLEESIGLFELKMKTKGIPFESELMPKQLFINKEGIQQAVTNLLQNAIQYYENDDLIPIKICGFVEGDMYEIQVTSPGPPIPEEDREWLFERFYRIDSSRSRKTGGTGLGLAIVKEIVVTHHQGGVGVTSSNNIHTFSMKLPMKNTPSS